MKICDATMKKQKDIAKKSKYKTTLLATQTQKHDYSCDIVRKQSNFNEDIFLLPTLLT